MRKLVCISIFFVYGICYSQVVKDTVLSVEYSKQTANNSLKKEYLVLNKSLEQENTTAKATLSKNKITVKQTLNVYLKRESLVPNPQKSLNSSQVEPQFTAQNKSAEITESKIDISNLEKKFITLQKSTEPENVLIQSKKN